MTFNKYLQGAQASIVNAYAVHVTTVRFNADGKYIYLFTSIQLVAEIRCKVLMQRLDQLRS